MKKQVITVLILMILAVTLLYAESKLVMGVYLYNMSQKDYDELGIKENYGVKVDVIVKDGPAEKAGLLPDDVIMKIDGEKVRSTDMVSKIFYSKKGGDNVKVDVLRDGTAKTFTISLQAKEIKDTPYMGVYLKDLSKKSYLDYGVEEKRGVLIKRVVDDTPADDAGLEDDDVLITFDGEKIYSDSQLHDILRDHNVGDKVKMEVIRDGDKETVKIKLGKREKEKEFFKVKS
jgi:S1-C subfamily serine protease